MKFLYLISIHLLLCIAAYGCTGSTCISAYDNNNEISATDFDTLILESDIALENLDSVTICHSFAPKDSSMISTFDLLIGKMQYIDQTGNIIAEGCCLGFEEGDWEAYGGRIGRWHYYMNDTTYTTNFGIRYLLWIQKLLDSTYISANGLVSKKYTPNLDTLDDTIQNGTKEKWSKEIKLNSNFIRHIVGIYQKDPAKFLTYLHGTLLYKSDFCMRDLTCLLIRNNTISKAEIAKDIASIPNLFVQNDLFEWLGYAIE